MDVADLQAQWGSLGTFPASRCEICDWITHQRNKTTDAMPRRGLVDAEIQHRQTMHPEGASR
jgi:hypothetical protein